MARVGWSGDGVWWSLGLLCLDFLSAVKMARKSKGYWGGFRGKRKHQAHNITTQKVIISERKQLSKEEIVCEKPVRVCQWAKAGHNIMETVLTSF